MPRGLRWANYFDDIGNRWALQVDQDHYLDGNRGWTDDSVESTWPLPRGWLPRRVAGWDGAGNLRSCVVAHTDAPLWVGSETTFVVEGTDGVPYVCTVTGRMEERRRLPHGPPPP